MSLVRTRNGFTLIELLLVIGIIGVLASVVIIAVDPVSQLRKAFGQERSHYANQLQRSIAQYWIDEEDYPRGVNFTQDRLNPDKICRLGQSAVDCINVDLIVPEYLSCLPYDTVETSTVYSGYSAYESTGVVQVSADHEGTTEQGGIECIIPPEPLTGFGLTSALAATITDPVTGVTATVNGMAAPSGLVADGPTGISSNSWLFDGVNDTLSIAYSSTYDFRSSLTIVAWVKPTSFTAADNVNAIARKGEANPNMWQLAIEDGYLTLMLEQGDGADGRAQSPSTLALNTWQHVAGTWDGTTASVYVNGALVDSGAYSGSVGGLLATDTRPVYIGGRAGSDYFAGNLYDVRLYDTALTAIQISDIAAGRR